MESSSQDIYEMHAIVIGDVQGVGFRSATRHFAKNLGITGTVRNLADGSVEIYAHGSKESLEKLIAKLKNDAFAKEITQFSFDLTSIQSAHAEFRIIS